MDLNILIDSVNRGGVTAEIIAKAQKTNILGISFDSRRCKKGDIFFCKGINFQPKYADSAVKRGATAVCIEKNAPYADEIIENTLSSHPQTAIVTVSNVKKALALASAELYRHPLSELKTIAVTGTKGKTTACNMIYNIINENPSLRGALLNNFLPPDATALTTPESPDFMYAARKCADLGYTHLVCEISSQAVKEERIFGMSFDIGCFLNFGLDHISPSEHRDTDEYFNCKKQLFLNCGCVVVNSNCQKSQEIIDLVIENDIKNTNKTEIHTFGFTENADFIGSSLTSTAEGCVFDFRYSKNTIALCTLGGIYNSENALCSASVGKILGLSDSEIINGILNTRVSGRMERLSSCDGRIDVIVDYAHNKMSFDAVFELARSLKKEITVVFGCPGNKAKCRRRELAESALNYADRIILTDDDSASEGFQSIKNEITENIKSIVSSLPKSQKDEILSKISVIPDRKTAIKTAILNASENRETRTVLILGKGDDRFQLTENGRAFYEGDICVAKKALMSYNKAHELLLIAENASKFKEKITFVLSDISSASALISAFEIFSQESDISVICPNTIAEALRELCFKSGRMSRVVRANNTSFQGKAKDICFYIAPESADTVKFGTDIAIKNRTDILVYLSGTRGIMLNGTGFVKRLSLRSAVLINKISKTPYLEDMIFALENGIGRCVLIDGRDKASVTHLISSLEFSGSEVIR